MSNFLTLEAGTLTIAAFFLAAAVFIATRPFMPKGSFLKIIIPTVLVLAGLVAVHYKMTTSRMASVQTAFANEKEVICENRSTRTGPQSVVISKALGWQLEGDLFVNPEFERPFHSARCITR